MLAGMCEAGRYVAAIVSFFFCWVRVRGAVCRRVMCSRLQPGSAGTIIKEGKERERVGWVVSSEGRISGRRACGSSYKTVKGPVY